MGLDRGTLERDFHAAMIDLAKKDKAVTGRIPSIFIRMINEHGGHGAAKRLLQSPLQDNLDALLNGLGHMTLDAGGKGTLGIRFTEKYVARYKTKR